MRLKTNAQWDGERAFAFVRSVEIQEEQTAREIESAEIANESDEKFVARVRPVTFVRGNGNRSCKGRDGKTACQYVATATTTTDGKRRHVCPEHDRIGATKVGGTVCAECGGSGATIRATFNRRKITRHGESEILSDTTESFRAYLCGPCAEHHAVTVKRNRVVRTVRGDSPESIQRDAWQALRADTQTRIADSVESVAWEMIADSAIAILATTGSNPFANSDAWEQATNATQAECLARVILAGIPSELIGTDVTPESVASFVRQTLASGIRFRDAGGTVRGPNGNRLTIRESGFMGMTDVLSANLSAARIVLSNRSRASRTESLDRTDESGNVIVRRTGTEDTLSVHSARLFGGIVATPEDHAFRPARVSLHNGEWGTVTTNAISDKSQGLRRSALASLSRTDRATLAEFLASGSDAIDGRTTEGKALRAIIGRYFDSCAAIDRRAIADEFGAPIRTVRTVRPFRPIESREIGGLARRVGTCS